MRDGYGRTLQSAVFRIIAIIPVVHNRTNNEFYLANKAINNPNAITSTGIVTIQ